MPSAPQFRHLRRELLRGGITPEFVERTVSELRDHYMDLRHDALARGCSISVAERQAGASLGRETEIADAVLEHAELKHWSARHPVAAACGRSLAAAVVIPVAPFVYCACRGSSIMRWSVSIGLGFVVTGALLRSLDYLMPLA